jgi:membrane-associated phospholipid phosphatase
MLPFLCWCQTASIQDSVKHQKTPNPKFEWHSLIIPAVFMTYGIASIDNHYLQYLNTETEEELAEGIDQQFTIDDFSQYAPALSVYALNLFGVEGKNNLRDRTMILATSFLLTSTTVTILKNTVKEQRPDGSSYNSFPSGHTATAFAGAEFLRIEYQDKSFWYGVAGYAVAVGTGFFRMYNQRHWLSDVAMGAGIGILSTDVAYWVFPTINDKLFKNTKNHSTSLVPFYNGEQAGLGLAMHF